MIAHRRRLALLAGTAALVTIGISDGNAGGFALREQSTYGQGTSFAGIAAGGALSSMFWNPSTLTQFDGKNFEWGAAGIIPNASHSFTTSTLGVLGNAPSNSGRNAIIPSSYSSWQINDRLWIGMSVNAPFGLGVKFPAAWAGAGYGQDSKLETYNFAPSVAYKINDWISVGAGVQIQYLKVSYDAFLNPAPLLIGNVSGTSWAFGWTAGVTLTPLAGTQIGIGYRSSLDQDISGALRLPAGFPASTPGSVNLTVKLPDTLTVGLRQRMSERFTLLAGVEWSNWSRIGTSALLQPSGAPALIGGNAVTFPFQYKDGWFYSLGGEYMVDPALTVRAGIAFEKGPITDQVRTPRLPDNDRMWYSAGASYKLPYFPGATFDLAYSYLDVKDAPITIGPGLGNPWLNATGTYIGNVSTHIQILSVALRYQFGAPPPPASRG